MRSRYIALLVLCVAFAATSCAKADDGDSAAK
jgi:hypothetical protein